MNENIKIVLDKLFGLQKIGVKLGLENIIRFLNEIGNPQLNLKCIHIAGSNGKGSTASFIASILMESGYKTGLYTSPHFVKFNERIKINGKEIEDKFIADFYIKYENYIIRNKLTFFEVTTAIAFQYFYDNNVDYAVIETGLGGRLDATNVINPMASVITSISLEHTNILGDTIEQIASEKAGIIKPGIKVFTGILFPGAEAVIEKKCEELNCELFDIEDYTIKRENYIELYTEELNIDRLDSPLRGYYQKYNAALAVLCLNKTLDIFNLTTIQKGILNVVKNSGLQGRYEIISESPKIILDSAHNPESIKHFTEEFKKEKKYQKRILLFTALRDKAIEEMLKALNNSFDEIHFTEINFERAANINDLIEIANKIGMNGFVEKDFIGFIQKFISEKSEMECLVILGSMYLLGEVKKSIKF